MLAAVMVGPQHAQAADQCGQLRCAQGQQLGLVDQHGLGRHTELAHAVVAKAVGDGLEQGEGLDIGLILTGIHPPRSEGYIDTHPGGLGSQLHADIAGQHYQVGQRGLGGRLLDLHQLG
ncbi:hypothetical protein D3C85_1091980 [compost metagenome]